MVVFFFFLKNDVAQKMTIREPCAKLVAVKESLTTNYPSQKSLLSDCPHQVHITQGTGTFFPCAFIDYLHE